MFRYDITESEIASEALEAISAGLSSSSSSLSSPIKHEPSLRLVSMKESYDVELLTRFYNELMIPNFPLEEERDDLEDWIYCLDPVQKENAAHEQSQPQPYPTMDVLILLRGGTGSGSTTHSVENNNNNNNSSSSSKQDSAIVAGVAFEYYRQAQCGLLSYVVVPVEYRRLGIMRSLHPVACRAMQLLHQESLYETASGGSAVLKNNDDNDNNGYNGYNNSGIENSTIRAIFAETNTVDAGDAPPAVIRKRHEILHQLGYRHLKFPYVQPALAEDAESFDDIMLLVYAPSASDSASDGDRSSRGDGTTTITPTTTIDTEILYGYVVDFFRSVTGYDNDSYKDDWYYKLVDWFRKKHPTTEITQDLPWDDVKEEILKERMVVSGEDVVVVVGGGDLP